jgi:hypothetical protein
MRAGDSHLLNSTYMTLKVMAYSINIYRQPLMPYWKKKGEEGVSFKFGDRTQAAAGR